MIDWLISFNVISTHLGLYYIHKIGNNDHCNFICTFLRRFFFLDFFSHCRIEYKYILNISTWPLDGTRKDTMAPG